MQKFFASFIQPFVKPFLAIALVVTLVFGSVSPALAAGGGRIGGGSFRAPAPRTYSPGPRTYAPGPGGGYYPGGGIGYPFVFPSPIFFVGGGGLFSLLIFLAIAGFILQSFRRQADSDLGYGTTNPTVGITRLQVGLLASARELQSELNELALKANTGSSEGLAEVLQETSLALLRHPEYWVYAGAASQPSRLAAAEAEFNRLALGERGKFSRETLSNVNNQLRQAEPKGVLTAAGGELAEVTTGTPGEYIVVTVLAATQGELKLPPINNEADLRQALQQLGGVSSDRLLALEVLWTPQAENDVLSSEDVLVQYPNLKLI
ncbi:MAG TPA: DUF1517 domain-containing protein [Leptolyngbyaceae cyanobacterium M33_DOE_097]|uniref:DUF1517 domain-containing protein n=1 Tax=Oscillatoriales cyanobacterium SpSt-418 TaxID=2282169 RepID=A0A7C3PH63_9CYAN|nr:DUF1517 domain-containing protein [Leptolyngbyaceae cyanobacterium M33_DOE_097]